MQTSQTLAFMGEDTMTGEVANDASPRPPQRAPYWWRFGKLSLALAFLAAAAYFFHEQVWILLACGVWVFIIIGWRFMIQNMKGVWAPVSETTAAYLDLSVERCRRKLVNFRFSMAFAMLLTI